MKLIPILACAALLAVTLAAQREGAERERPQRSGQEPPSRSRGGFGLDAKVLETLLKKYDQNGDGKIERAEYPRSDTGFDNLDRDQNGAIEKKDIEARPQRGQRARRQGGRGTPASRPAPAKLPQVDEVAPDFELPFHDAEAGKDAKVRTVKLSSFAGDKPVALIFGSYT